MTLKGKTVFITGIGDFIGMRFAERVVEQGISGLRNAK